MGGVPYALPADLQKAFPKILTSGWDMEELRGAIDRAGHRIDAFLARRYAVPFSTVPPFIQDACVYLAVMDVLDRHQATPDWLERRVEQLNADLTALAEGTIALPDGSGGTVDELTTTGTLTSNTRNFVPIFGAVPSLAERYDPNRASAESGARGGGTYEDE